MKKFLSVILASLIFAAAGCSGNNGEAATTTTTTTTAAVTTTAAETTTEAATTTTEAVTTTTEATTTEAVTTTTEALTTEIAPETGIDSDIGSIELVGTGLIQGAKTGDGFVTYDRSAISKDIAASGMTEKKLTSEAVMADHELLGNNTQNVYVFAMVSKDGVQEYPSNDSSVFMSMLILNNEAYAITFGTGDKVSMEEVAPYCTAEKYIEYWAFATVGKDGRIILMPFIAGSEQNGYYLVQPVMKMLNADTSDMTIPSPVGDDYYNTEPAVTDTPEDNETPALANGSAKLDINNVKNSDDFTTVDITIANNYNVPLNFIGNNIVINGVDCGMFIAYWEVPAMSKIDDYLWVDGYDLKAGDELEITLMVQNSENFDDYGPITFKMTLESHAINT